MTSLLMRFLNHKYKNIDKLQKVSVSGYPPPDGHERIYFTFIHKNYLNKRDIITKEQIIDSSNKVFTDIGHEFYDNKGLEENIMMFDFKGKMNKYDMDDSTFAYQSNYSGHYISFDQRDFFLGITISTGNRGAPALKKQQRKNYARFIDMIVIQSLENTK